MATAERHPETRELFFENLEIPAESLMGTEGQGFRYILDGQNQGVPFPIAEVHSEVEAAELMRWEACRLFDAHQPCGARANMAKYLAAKADLDQADPERHGRAPAGAATILLRSPT